MFHCPAVNFGGPQTRAAGLVFAATKIVRPRRRCSRSDAGDRTRVSGQERACPKSASDQPRPVSGRADRQLNHCRADEQHIPNRLNWTGRFWPTLRVPKNFRHSRSQQGNRKWKTLILIVRYERWLDSFVAQARQFGFARCPDEHHRRHMR